MVHPEHSSEPAAKRSSKRNISTKLCLTMTQDDNPFRQEAAVEGAGSFGRVGNAVHQPSHPNVPDAVSAVSSITYFTPKRHHGKITTTNPASPQHNVENCDFPPPKVIVIPTTCTSRIVPEWLRCSDTSLVVPPPAPDVLGRGLTAPPHGILRPSMVRRGCSAPPMLAGNTPGLAAIHRGSTSSTATPPGSRNHTNNNNSSTLKPDTLVGNRPRRKHERDHSHCISIGSLVGQSSLLTDPTISSSSVAPSHEGSPQRARPSLLKSQGTLSFRAQRSPMFPRASLLTRSARNLRHTLEPTQENPPRPKCRNPVKREMLYVLEKVTKPVKNLVKSNGSMEPQCDLHRSNGCLV
ncbi:hypothetical protein ACA910_015116 [Epithemia clementina (nom. ined.)]